MQTKTRRQAEPVGPRGDTEGQGVPCELPWLPAWTHGRLGVSKYWLRQPWLMGRHWTGQELCLAGPRRGLKAMQGFGKVARDRWS